MLVSTSEPARPSTDESHGHDVDGKKARQARKSTLWSDSTEAKFKKQAKPTQSVQCQDGGRP